MRFYATALLFGIARSGELTTKSMKAFNPAINIPARNLRRERIEASGTEVVILHILKTKADQVNGEDIRFSSQPSLDIDPVKEMENHLRINAPAPDEHLFAYSLIRPKTRPSRVPLSYQRFSSRMREAAEEAGIRSLLGHAFRIEGTLLYLLDRISFETVKVMGRWKSDAFHVYLRKHAQVLAPYLQVKQGLQAELFHFMTRQLPPVR